MTESRGISVGSANLVASAASGPFGSGMALNGAEPVSPATLERFIARFGRYGFRPEAMAPVYGLAECSVE